MNRVTAVRGGRVLFASMDVKLSPGEAMVVVGPNGAGKSSFLRIAAGLLRPAEGSVERARAALADESLALEPRRTLTQALDFWAKLDGGDPAPAMEAMGLTRLAEVPVRMLSTGQRKRAALARVMASGAPLWLLDEPSNGLDADALERLAAAMAAHRAGGGAILAATHQPFGLGQAHEIWLK
jgi:heme exporter protein A